MDIEKVLEELVDQNKKLFTIVSKQDGEYLKMDEKLQDHFKEDTERFGRSEEDHKEFKESIKKITDVIDGFDDDTVSDFKSMLKMFRDNKIFEVQLEKKTGKLVLYARNLSLLAGGYLILKIILERVNIHLP